MIFTCHLAACFNRAGCLVSVTFTHITGTCNGSDIALSRPFQKNFLPTAPPKIEETSEHAQSEQCWQAREEHVGKQRGPTPCRRLVRSPVLRHPRHAVSSCRNRDSQVSPQPGTALEIAYKRQSPVEGKRGMFYLYFIL